MISKGCDAVYAEGDGMRGSQINLLLCEEFLDDFRRIYAGETLVEALEFKGKAFVIEPELIEDRRVKLFF